MREHGDLSNLQRWRSKAVQLIRCPRCRAKQGKQCRVTTGPNQGSEYAAYVHEGRMTAFVEEYREGERASRNGEGGDHAQEEDVGQANRTGKVLPLQRQQNRSATGR